MDGARTATALIPNVLGYPDDLMRQRRAGAYYLPFVPRTLEAYGGLVFAKTPARTVPDALNDLMGDITGAGQDIDRFAEQAFDAVLEGGAVMILVDYPEAPEGLTNAEAEAGGVRPVLRLYAATSILAARVERVGAMLRLAHVRVEEAVEEESHDDPFNLDVITQVRVLELGETGYTQRVFREIDGEWIQHGEEVEPRRQGKRLTVIPAFFANPRDAEPTPHRPPLADLADISIAHLRNSASMEWALEWLGNPILFGKELGFKEGEEREMAIGSSSMVHGPNPGSDLKIVTAPAEAVGALAGQMDAKRKDAAMMGARLLLEQGRQAIAAETARIERAGETSVIAGIANALSDCLTKALTFMADWAGIGGEVEYWLNTDLNPSGLSAQEITALLASWQSGAITLHDLFQNFQRAEIVDPAKSFEDHREELEAEGGGLGAVEDREAA